MNLQILRSSSNLNDSSLLELNFLFFVTSLTRSPAQAMAKELDVSTAKLQTGVGG